MIIGTTHPRAESARGDHEGGFSVAEILIVVAVMLIMLAMAIPALRPNRAAYRTEDAALQIISFMRDASQRALSQRQIMRVEIDTTANRIRIRDENSAAIPTASPSPAASPAAALAATDDDKVVREETLVPQTEVRCDTNPTGIAVFDSTFPRGVFAGSQHPAAGGNTMWQARFRPDGSVVNAGDNAQSANAAITSSTLFIWSPRSANSNDTSNVNTVRAITVSGATGSVRYWKYNGTSFVAK